MTTTATPKVKVFILAGQSNMQGHAQLSTLPYVGMDLQTAPLLQKIQTGDPPSFVEHENVWISGIGFDRVGEEEERHGKLTVGFGANHQKLGPELMFGVRMKELIEEAATTPNQQILIIKTAWGGKSLNTDFRSPSAGPFQYNQEQLQAALGKHAKDNPEKIEQMQEAKRQASGKYYGLMIKHVRHVLKDISRIIPTYTEEQGYEIAGFVYFQAWNDVTDRWVYPTRGRPGGYDEYGRLLSLFIQDVRKDLSTPDLPFAIGVIGVGGTSHDEDSLHGRFRRAMEMPVKDEQMTNVVAVKTEEFWDDELDALDGKWGKAQTLIKKWKEEQAKMEKEEGTRKLQPAEEKQKIEELTHEAISPKEINLLQMAKSNAGYHYLGSSKFFVRAGKAFAEALFNLQ